MLEEEELIIRQIENEILIETEKPMIIHKEIDYPLEHPFEEHSLKGHWRCYELLLYNNMNLIKE